MRSQSARASSLGFMRQFSQSTWRRWALAIALALAPAAASGADDKQPVDFAKQIRPIFMSHCVKCHGPKKQASGYRLDIKSRALEGGDSGEDAIVPGEAEKSPLVQLIRGDNPEFVMPPEGERLDEKQIKLLIRWIDEGAKWPEVARLAALG